MRSTIIRLLGICLALSICLIALLALLPASQMELLRAYLAEYRIMIVGIAIIVGLIFARLNKIFLGAVIIISSLTLSSQFDASEAIANARCSLLSKCDDHLENQIKIANQDGVNNRSAAAKRYGRLSTNETTLSADLASVISINADVSGTNIQTDKIDCDLATLEPIKLSRGRYQETISVSNGKQVNRRSSEYGDLVKCFRIDNDTSQSKILVLDAFDDEGSFFRVADPSIRVSATDDIRVPPGYYTFDDEKGYEPYGARVLDIFPPGTYLVEIFDSNSVIDGTIEFIVSDQSAGSEQSGEFERVQIDEVINYDNAVEFEQQVRKSGGFKWVYVQFLNSKLFEQHCLGIEAIPTRNEGGDPSLVVFRASRLPAFARTLSASDLISIFPDPGIVERFAIAFNDDSKPRGKGAYVTIDDSRNELTSNFYLIGTYLESDEELRGNTALVNLRIFFPKKEIDESGEFINGSCFDPLIRSFR